MKNTFLNTPPMGWNSWDCFGASVTEDEVKANALFMAENLKKFGWKYVVVDIQWSEPEANSTRYNDFYPLCMDEFSRLIPAENRFPSSINGQGFKPLADYIHSLGLKFGIHIMRGIPRQAVHQNGALLGTDKTAREIALNNICPWNSDMYGINVDIEEGQRYYDSIFELYAQWEVDFIKVDDIAISRLYQTSHQKEIVAINKAIKRSGREMVLSLSPGPAKIEEAEFLSEYAHMWRLTDDLWDNWDSVYAMFEKAKMWSSYVKEGSYPDCDMLPLGHIGIRAVDGGGGDNWSRLTPNEQYTMMSLWTIFGSPLIFGGTLTDIDEFTLSLLINEDVLEMYRTLNYREEIYRDHTWIIWKAKSNNHHYYAIFNVASQKQKLEEKITKLLPKEGMYDLWKHSNIDINEVTIAEHGVLLVKIV